MGYYDQGNWQYVDERGPDSAGGTGEFWQNQTTGERLNASSSGLGTPWDLNAKYQQIWNNTPGDVDAKLQAVAAQGGTGYFGAVQWAQNAGIGNLWDSGVGRAAQQSMNDGGGIGGAIGKYVGPLIKPAIAAGTAVLGGLAAAPYLGAGTGAAAGTEAVGAAGAAPAATSVGGAAGGAIESALSTAALPSGGIGAATGAGAGASSALGTLGAAGAGAAALPDAGVDMGIFQETGNPYVMGSAGLPAGALAAAALPAAAGGSSLFGGLAGSAAAGAAGSATSGAMSNTSGSIMGDEDWLKILGRGIPGILGAVGSASQAEDYEDLANKYMEMGAPYRSRLQQLYGDPSAFLNSAEVRQPIQQGTDMLARSLSVKGNPAGSGNALQELQNYASTQLFNKLGQEKDRLGGFGGLSQYNQAAPQAAQNVIGAQGDVYSNLGGAAADIFNPPKRYSLQDFLRY